MVAALVTVLATLATAVLGQTLDPCPPCDQVSDSDRSALCSSII